MKKTLLLIVIFILFTTLGYTTMSFCDEKNISASYIDEYPLTFKNEAGEADGFAIDLLNYIFEKEGIVVTYKHMTWSDALKSVDDKTVDLIIDILKTDDRLEKYDFNNEPFFFGWGTLIAYNDNSIENILDLNGKTIGYLRDDNYAVGPNGLVENINRFNISTDYLAYNDYGSILEALNNNVLDAAIVSRLMESQLHNYRNIKKTGIVFAPGGFFIAGPKGSNKVLLDTVDQYLRQLKADEESFFYDRYNYWFKSLQPNLIRDFYYENKVSIFIIGFLIVFFLGFSRYEVYRKSKDLRATNELLSKHVNQLNNANEELESAYQDIDLLVEKYDLLIHFLSSNPYAVYECDESFMKRLLSISYSLLDGVDFAFAYKTLNHSTLKIIDLIGYKPFSSLQLDLSRLNVLKEGIFIKSDFYENLLLTAKDESTNLIIRELMTMTKETLIINFNSKEYHYGILLNIKKSSEQSFNRTAKEVMSAFKNVADTYFIIKHLFAKHNQFQKEMLHSINEMLEIHDEYTRGHSENVANLAKALAEYVDLSAESVDTTYWAALVHDIGKILIPSHILNKKGALTDLEYTEMKNHPYYGYKALRTSDLTKDIAEIVLCHHERFDGLGYPNQLAGDDIPIESKILTIADAYDAMTSKRSYKTALTIEEAFEEIENNLGKQFDPDLGEKFIEMLKKQKL